MSGGAMVWVSLPHGRSPSLANARFLVRMLDLSQANAMLAIIDSRRHGRITSRQYGLARQTWLVAYVVVGTGLAGREALAWWGPCETLRLLSPLDADLLLLAIASATLRELQKGSAMDGSVWTRKVENDGR
jgi:hypothetical protein